VTQTLKVPGLVLTDHVLSVPLDHDRSDGETIEVFAREVAAPDGRERPSSCISRAVPGRRPLDRQDVQLHQHGWNGHCATSGC